MFLSVFLTDKKVRTVKEKTDNKEQTRPESMADVIRKREELDKVLQDKFVRKMTVVFTDVCGYTQYMDKMGDIRGQVWIQRHNDIVLPLIEKHGGTVLKLMGDGVMSSFENTSAAIEATIDIQRTLNEYNLKPDTIDEIHITAGINSGNILVDGDEIAGDVVNVASRIEAKAEKDQILVSRSVYDEVYDNDDIRISFHGKVPVKGKPEPLELYRVFWRDDLADISDTPKVRAHEAIIDTPEKTPVKVITLEVERTGDRMKICAYQHLEGETSTIRHYEEIAVPIEQINIHCRETADHLNKANRKGRVSRDVLEKLKKTGQVFYNVLFTPEVRKKFETTDADHLVINMNDQLVHIPWELLHNGRQFLCRQFNMGRLVSTRQNALGSGTGRSLSPPLSMLILADPKGDLKGAYSEGIGIRDNIALQKGLIHAEFKSDNIDPDYVRSTIGNYDIVHFAGHFDYNHETPEECGWRLSNGCFKASEVKKMAGDATMPSLIFSNACQSARTGEWTIGENYQDDIFGLANAFVLSGVKHYMGTSWEILDEAGKSFAQDFYHHLLSGTSIGESIRKARINLIDGYGEDTIVWASYVLYGDPSTCYTGRVTDSEGSKLKEPSTPPVRSKEEIPEVCEAVTAFPEIKKRSAVFWLKLAAVIVILTLTISVSVSLWFQNKNSAENETAVLMLYDNGKFDEAMALGKTIIDKSPRVGTGYLVCGDVYFRKGKLEQAGESYHKVLSAPKGTTLQKSRAYIGLGRIASLRKKPDDALNYYRLASETAPLSSLGYVSQAMLLMDQKKFEEALGFLEKAMKITPDDPVITAVANETRRKMATIRDSEKQGRIDRLVKDLLETMNQPARALPSDAWTSQPLAMLMMDFEISGFSLTEGEERLLFSGITEKLLENPRIRLVERAILDKLLTELKLGASNLTDRRTALTLGRLMAARFILTGKIIYSGPQSHILMRLIETETGRITASVNEEQKGSKNSFDLAGRLSENLLGKITKAYPLRAKILEINKDGIVLNIGSDTGTTAGLFFKVINRNISLEIISVDLNKSFARVSKGESAIEQGLRVEEILIPER